jgi:hypothetical protein
MCIYRYIWFDFILFYLLICLPVLFFFYYFVYFFVFHNVRRVIIYRYDTIDIKRISADQPNPDHKPVMIIPERIANLKELHAYFSKVVSVAVPIANDYYYFFKVLFSRFKILTLTDCWWPRTLKLYEAGFTDAVQEYAAFSGSIPLVQVSLHFIQHNENQFLRGFYIYVSWSLYKFLLLTCWFSVRRKQRQFTVQEWAQWYANLLLVNEQREVGRDRSGYSVGPTRGVNHSGA